MGAARALEIAARACSAPLVRSHVRVPGLLGATCALDNAASGLGAACALDSAASGLLGTVCALDSAGSGLLGAVCASDCAQ